ncbi:hypothetical protein BUALT_Bualt02G0106300 [Buddleja alternifolia]|uniref:Uncharacterized protein n=1 Tax=Buddleja alternifolia TaxID=168488 RepID=A0AAV6XZ81_9LAMI|nr:hypothetical protein BUALT_Bualt02G0106300 [Buddleja alternifolia]
MSSSHPYMNTTSNPNFDEQRWIIHIRRLLEEDHDQESNMAVSIFDIPKTLMLVSPESYVPQIVALGPYHHYRPELYEMERYKLSAAKRAQKQLPGLKFENHVYDLSKFEPTFRACYHKYLNFNSEILAWMMALDSCFLLEFLEIFAVKEGKALTRVSSRMSHLVDMSGRKSGHNAIIRDIVMLENQIPLFLLRKMLEFRQGSDDLLYSMLMGFCKEILPFKIIQENPSVHQVMGFAHMLDFLYHLIVPKLEGSTEIASEVTNSGIFGINFDKRMATVYVPSIILNGNTEVAIRNLVAYEACNASGPLIFTRYTELMNGIIDTEDDAKLLREQGIVLNHLKSDQDVANLWNGMSKSIRLTKVPLLDKVIEDVNNYYNGSWKVRIGKFMARNVFGSWQSLTLMAAILLLFFMSLQSYCSLFSCARVFLYHKKMN